MAAIARTTFRQKKRTRTSKRRTAFRLDLRRAATALGGVAGALVLTFFVATREKPEKPVEAEYGRDLRTGSILVMPLVGDTCQQGVFDNDTGGMQFLDPISCEEAIRRSIKSARSNADSHVQAVSENFRR